MVKMTYVAHDRSITHRMQMLRGDHMQISSCCDENIADPYDIFYRDNAVTLHRSLQGTDRVNFRNKNIGSKRAHRLCASLTNIAVPQDQDVFSSNHDIGRTFDAIDQRLSASVKIVEF